MPKSTTPVYCLDTFGEKAKESSLYTETLATHLRDHSFVNDPHKHDFYLVLYVTKGSGTHTIDFNTYKVQPGIFFVMTPGQVHSWKLDPGTDGFIIFFTRDFYKLHSGENNLDDFGKQTSIQTNRDGSFELVMRQLLEEHNLKIQRAWLEVLILKLISLQDQSTDLNPVIFKIRKLGQLIDKNFLHLKKPSDYANLMNISPAYLNNLCKRHLGKTSSDLINERIVLEAKRLFAYTDLSVSQVADRLRFSEPSYFIRFFRKNTGATPEHFKESMNRPIQ
jgi:AraC-like DNA-binding protein